MASYSLGVAVAIVPTFISTTHLRDLVRSVGGRLLRIAYTPEVGSYAIALSIDSGTLSLLGALAPNLPDSPN